MDLKTVPKKLIGSNEDRAVSPVIGVVLMVAVTVILAAVIAAFVMGMGDDMGSQPINAHADVDVDDDENATVSVNELDNADGMTVVNASGSPVETDEVLTSTAATYEWNLSDADDGPYSVVAFIGDVEELDDEELDEQVEETAVVDDIELD